MAHAAVRPGARGTLSPLRQIAPQDKWILTSSFSDLEFQTGHGIVPEALQERGTPPMIRAANSSVPQRYTSADFAHSPFVVFYEVTRACDLVCLHCRACAQAVTHPDELSPEQSQALLRQLAKFPLPPLTVLTGGDPFKRPDLVSLVECGTQLGLELALTPSATPLVTFSALRRLKSAGLARLALSLDGATAPTHDRFRGVQGSFDRTLEIVVDAQAAGLPVQVNTTITPDNFEQIDEMAALLAAHRIVLWSVFFLVPVGRGTTLPRITPAQYEQAFDRLWAHARRYRYGIKTTEAPHFRRYAIQRSGRPASSFAAPASRQRAPLGINDGKGILFVSHSGQIYPSGFLPLLCGAFPNESVVDVYQKSPVFRALRDANALEGKCGACDFRAVCGGSRARAFALTGNPLAAEPDCLYQPEGYIGS